MKFGLVAANVVSFGKVSTPSLRPARLRLPAAPGHRDRDPAVWSLPGPDRQAAELAAVRETGLMWANALRAFQVGKARTSHDGPSSWMRRSRVASAQGSWPACHLTNASASAVT